MSRAPTTTRAEWKPRRATETEPKLTMAPAHLDPSLWLSGTCVGVIVAVMIAAMVML